MSVKDAKGPQLFDFVGDLSTGKKDLLSQNPLNEKLYNAYMVNLAFSQHIDTVLFCNDMNMNSHLSRKAQHDYYLHGLPKRNRYGKWIKKTSKDDDETVDMIARRFNVNTSRAREYLAMMSADAVARVRADMTTGGR